jgi:hypothetical protein
VTIFRVSANSGLVWGDRSQPVSLLVNQILNENLIGFSFTAEDREQFNISSFADGG